MKKKILTNEEKLDSIYKWAIAVQNTFRTAPDEIVKVSKTEMIEKFQEVIKVIWDVQP